MWYSPTHYVYMFGGIFRGSATEQIALQDLGFHWDLKISLGFRDPNVISRSRWDFKISMGFQDLNGISRSQWDFKILMEFQNLQLVMMISEVLKDHCAFKISILTGLIIISLGLDFRISHYQTSNTIKSYV